MQALTVTDQRTAGEAGRTIANNPSDFRVPFAFRSDEGGGYRDMGGILELTGVSWDFFERLRSGEPGRITLHADLRQWAARTDPNAKPELARYGRLDIEIDFTQINQRLPTFRAFGYSPGAREQSCVSSIQLYVSSEPFNPTPNSAGINWGNPLDPLEDWRPEAIRKCIQANSETLFWLLRNAKMVAERTTVHALAQSSAISTLGFDIVFATTLACINRDLSRNSERLATTFSYAAAGDGLQMQGKFGTWQIIAGGSGTLVHLVIPITAGSLTAKGRLDTINADLAGISVTVESDLTMVPSATTGQKELRFAFQAGQAAGAKMASVIKVDGPPDKVAKVGELLKMHLPQCLDANAENLAYVFATIHIAEPGTNDWLAPAQCAYCFAQPQGSAETFVALLGSGAAMQIRPQDLRVDPALLGGLDSPGPDSGYLAVSKNTFMSNVIQPSLERIFPGTTTKAFQFDSGSQKIVNAAPFALPSISVANGTYTPMVTSLEVTIDHGALITYLSGACDMGLNITLNFSLRTTCAMTFDKASQSFSFEADPHPDITSNADIPWYDYFLILAGIPGLIIATIEVLALTGLVSAFNTGSIRASPSQSGSYSLCWGGMRAFQVDDAGFATSFYMRGHLQ